MCSNRTGCPLLKMNTSTLDRDAIPVGSQVDGKSCELWYAQCWVYLVQMMLV